MTIATLPESTKVVRFTDKKTVDDRIPYTVYMTDVMNTCALLAHVKTVNVAAAIGVAEMQFFEVFAEDLTDLDTPPTLHFVLPRHVEPVVMPYGF